MATDAIDDIEDFGTDDLRRKVASGLGWKVTSQIFGQGTQMAMSVVLAHLLVPTDYGVAGMAFVFSGFLAILTDLSLGAALVQRKDLTERDRSTVFWLTIGGGSLCALIGVALSPFVADFFSTPEVEPMFALISLGFVVTAAGQTQNALLTRAMRFRSLEIRQIIAVVVGAIVALGLALGGFGPWTIVGQILCTNCVSTALLWVLSPWRPQRVFSRESFTSLGSFGVKALFSRLLVYINFTGDNLLVGKYLGSQSLGVYTVAYNVMWLPMSRVTAPISQVLYSAFARLQNDRRRLGEVWLRVNRMTSALLAPIFFGLAAVAPDLVPVVFGQKWRASIPILQLLSFGGVAQALQIFNGPVYQAQGRPGLFLRFMTFSTAVTFGGFVIGLHWGITGVAASYAVARTIVLGANTALICRTVELKLRRTLVSYFKIVGVAAFMAVVVYLARQQLIHYDVPAGMRLIILIPLGAIVYAGVLAWREPDLLAEVRAVRRRRP
jgi:O-antigen/teichoic acid export membrane protein